MVHAKGGQNLNILYIDEEFKLLRNRYSPVVIDLLCSLIFILSVAKI